jgi:hypothetical protein
MLDLFVGSCTVLLSASIVDIGAWRMAALAIAGGVFCATASTLVTIRFLNRTSMNLGEGSTARALAIVTAISALPAAVALLVLPVTPLGWSGAALTATFFIIGGLFFHVWQWAEDKFDAFRSGPGKRSGVEALLRTRQLVFYLQYSLVTVCIGAWLWPRNSFAVLALLPTTLFAASQLWLRSEYRDS